MNRKQISWGCSPSDPAQVLDMQKWTDVLKNEQLENPGSVVVAPYLTLAQDMVNRTKIILNDSLNNIHAPDDFTPDQVADYVKDEARDLKTNWRSVISGQVKLTIERHPELFRDILPFSDCDMDTGETDSGIKIKTADFAKNYLDYYKTTPPPLEHYKSRGYIYVASPDIARNVLQYYRNTIKSAEIRLSTYSNSRVLSPQDMNKIIFDYTPKLYTYMRAILLKTLLKENKKLNKHEIRDRLYRNNNHRKYFSPYYHKEVQAATKNIFEDKTIPATTEEILYNFGIAAVSLLRFLGSALPEGGSIVSRVVQDTSACITTDSGFLLVSSEAEVAEYKNRLRLAVDKATIKFNEVQMRLKSRWPEL